MHFNVVTTITSRIEVSDDGIEGVTHSVVIDGDDEVAALPRTALMATVEGGCKSVIKSIKEGA